MKSSTPRPFLIPTMCSCQPPGEGLKRTIESRGLVCGLHLSQCGQYLAADIGECIAVVNIETGEQVQYLKGHEGEVILVRFNSIGSLIISSSELNSVIAWDWKKKSTPSHVCREAGICGLAWSSHGSKFFSVDADRQVKIWETETVILENTLTVGNICISER